MNLFKLYPLLCIETFAFAKIFSPPTFGDFLLLWLAVPLYFGFAQFISTIIVLASIMTGKVPCRLLTTKAQSS